MAEDKNAPQRQELPRNQSQNAPRPAQAGDKLPSAAQAAGGDAEKRLRQQHEDAVARRAEYPQDSADGKSKPTPTQEENDQIRLGLRSIDDKEHDGSGPDRPVVMRRLSAEEAERGDYKTR